MSSPTVGAGSVLSGRYRLLEPLASGGMGTVWRAVDLLLDRPVAIKEVRLPPGLDDDSRTTLRRRTIREAQAAARLRHSAIVTVFDVVEQDDRPWIVMELVHSRSLAQVIREDGPLPPARVASIGLRVLGAMVTAQAGGVQHRDIKPANVLITDEGRVVLTDFGIARHIGDETLTSAGLLLGSPDYLAPERARGHRSEGLAADLWSLGAMMYDAVEGRRPFEREGALPTLAAVVMDEPPPPVRAGPLRAVIDGRLIKDPAHRLDAARTQAMLERVVRGRPASGTVPFPRQRDDAGRRFATTPMPVDRSVPPAGTAGNAPQDGAGPENRADPTPAADAAAGRVETTPARQAPTEETPTEAAPTEEASAGQAPAGQAPAEEAPAEEARAEQTNEPSTTGAVPEDRATPAVSPPPADPDEARPTPPAADPGPTRPAQKPPAAPLPGAARPAQTPPAADPGPARPAQKPLAVPLPGSTRPPRESTAVFGPGGAGPAESRLAVPGSARPAEDRPDQDGTSTPSRRRPAVLAVLALVALAVIAVAFLPRALSDDRGGQAAPPATAAAAASQSAGTASPGTASPGTASSGTASSGTASSGTASSGTASSGSTAPSSSPASRSASPSPAPAATGAAVTVPAGFTRYTDRTDGFSLIIPTGWRPIRRKTRVDFDDPTSSRFLRIDTSDHPLADPYRNWIDYERTYRQGKVNYRRIDIRRVPDYRAAAGWTTADWEFTIGGTHVLDRNIRVNGSRAHAIYWSTPSSRWDTADSRRIFDLAAASFVPAPVRN